MNRTSPGRVRGFTLAELAIGLSVLALVLGAVAAMSLAVSGAWRASEASATVGATARRSTSYVESLLRSAQLVGLATRDGQFVAETNSTVVLNARPGATLMIWLQDGTNPMVLGKIAMVQHDIAERTLLLYTVRNDAPGASIACTASDINDSNDAERFKAVPGVESQVLARDVREASFLLCPVSQSSTKSTVEVVLAYGSGDVARTEYGTVVLEGIVAAKP